MAKIRIIYGSETGNTRQAAHIIENWLNQYGHKVQILAARETEPTDICRGVELTVLGSSSRGDNNSISFPPSFAHFYEKLREGKIKRKKIALFGCGDRHKPFFCGAVELLKEKVGDLGGELITKPLYIDGSPLEAQENLQLWSQEVSQSLIENR